jgi:prepilin-type N-terminal cleavage/methylation domain-containing protein
MKGGLHTRRALTALRSTKHSQRGSVATGGRNNLGFTIIEVLIVLAITGGLFISAATMISGRTAKTQFEQAVNQMTGQIRQQINDVSSGFYPNSNNFICAPNAAGNAVAITAASTTDNQGTNDGCIFLGKTLYFGKAAGTEPERYVSFPVAALQRDTAGDEVTSIAAAAPAVIYPVAPNPNAPNGSQTTPLQYGLTVSKMYYNGNTANTIGAVAFLSSLGQYNGTDLVSGSQQVSMIPIRNTSIGRTNIGTAASDLNANLASSGTTFTTTPATEVAICFDSGTTNQSGLITIGGGSGRQLSVTLSIKGSTGC